MRRHWSLVMFTLSIQASVGCLWCMQAGIFSNDGGDDLLYLRFQILTTLCLVLAGLAAAMTHLGKPGDSLYAVKNIQHSWLSREILSVSLFAGSLAVIAAASFFYSPVLSSWGLLAGSLTGGMALYAMTRVYIIRTVPCWNHAGTPLNFLGSAFLLGGLLIVLGLNLKALLQGVSLDTLGLEEYRIIAYTAVLMGFLLKISAAAKSPSGISPFGQDKIRLPLMQGCGIALWLVYVAIGGSIVVQPILLCLAATCLVAGEIIQRIDFYNSYQRVGL